jgi:hypothetical protein
MQQEVPERIRERVAAGVGHLVTLAGDDAFVVIEGHESVTVLDDAVGFVLKDKWERARPEQTVIVYIGGHPAPVQMIVEKWRLRLIPTDPAGRRY